eukprot:gene10138-11173_t
MAMLPFRFVREKPVHSSRAHVFQIDPETKSRWLPMSKNAVTVSLYYDAVKRIYRVVSVDGTRALVNSVIQSNMQFTKTSLKFGQFSDQKASNVYGLGFTTEADLNEFSKKFNKAREGVSPVSWSISGSDSVKSETNSYPELDENIIHRSISSNESIEDDTTGSHKSVGNSVDSQLKYENDRLKQALAQSSSNAKKWEKEFQTLKNNNAKLTAALQESTINVEKWKEQLNNYREENMRLKKVIECESASGSSEAVDKVKKEMENQIAELKSRLKLKDEETARYLHQNNEIAAYRERNAEMNIKIQQLQTENRRLAQTNAQHEQMIQKFKTNDSKIKELKELEGDMKKKLEDLISLQQKMSLTLQP